jgi:hypothetical protein
MAKWNELLRIERALGSRSRYAGAAVLNRPEGRSSRSGSPAPYTGEPRAVR